MRWISLLFFAIYILGCTRDGRSSSEHLRHEIADIISEASVELTEVSDSAWLPSHCEEDFRYASNEVPGETLPRWVHETSRLKTRALERLAYEGLTIENATTLALLNNPDLKASLIDITVAHADIFEASLLNNPSRKAKVRVNDDTGVHENTDVELVDIFFDFFLQPLRKNLAITELAVVESEILKKISDLIRQVHSVWFVIKIADLELAVWDKRVKLREHAGILAEKNNADDVSEKTAQHFIATTESRALRIRLVENREKMNRLLGLFHHETCWHLGKHLDYEREFFNLTLPELQTIAMGTRPELRMVQYEIAALQQKAELKAPWTYLNANFGRNHQLNHDGANRSGPMIEYDLPINNFGQAQLEKSKALIEQAHARRGIYVTQINSEVREFFLLKDICKKEMEDLKNVILPKFARLLKNTLQGVTDVVELSDVIALKEKQMDAFVFYLQAIQRYVEAKINLSHAVGKII